MPAPCTMPASSRPPDPAQARPIHVQTLQDTIRAIERRSLSAAGRRTDALKVDRTERGEPAWSLGAPAIDTLLGAAGLETGAIHEIKPAAGASWAAGYASAHRFALALAVRRLDCMSDPRGDAPALLCMSSAHGAELGAPYGPGLTALGLDPSRLIVVEPAKLPDALWAIEEGLKSNGLALVLGLIDDIQLTPARRLALAAAGSGTPCLLLTHPRAGPAAATATRWRIGPAQSAPDTLDERAPGATRFSVGLERCRNNSAAPPTSPWLLEWCDAAYRFRMASSLADGASGAHAPPGRSHLAVHSR